MLRLNLSPVLFAFLASPASALQETFPAATPESQSISPEALQALVDEVDSYVEHDLAVGAELVVIKNRKTVLHEVFGMADIEDEESWTRGVVCNIRSMSKPLTGAALQILIDRGELGIDDLVGEYLEGFQNAACDLVTVRQILSHRAGLPLTILSTSIDEFPSLIDMANAVGKRGPQFEPDSRFWYSDAGTEVVGALVETLSGKKLDEFVRTELLEPLGMTDSFYFIEDDDPRRVRVASMYMGGPGAWQRFLDPDEEALYPFAWGSQSIYSTPHDYARFLCLWMDGGKVGDRVILSAEAIARQLGPASEMSMLGSDARFPTSFKGLEVYYGQMSVLHVPLGSNGEEPAKILGHSGSDGTIAWAWPEHDLIVLYFTQSRGGGSALRLEETIDRHLISPGLYEAEDAVPTELEPYVGTYIADWASHMREEFIVHVKNGELAVDVPSQMDYTLTPAQEEGRWHFAVSDTVTVWFENDDTGAVDCLRIQQNSMVFEAPRKDSPHDTELRQANRADAEALAHLLGEYDDPTADGNASILVDGDYLAVAGGGETYHLWKVPTDDVWVVRQNPRATITFQVTEGVTWSFTRKDATGAEVVFERLP